MCVLDDAGDQPSDDRGTEAIDEMIKGATVLQGMGQDKMQSWRNYGH